MKLHSKRLLKICEMITQYKTGNTLADIGTDHAYLPCFLYKNHVIEKAYACDVAEGPLASSQATITHEGVTGHVIPLLGDGLDPVASLPTDMIAICGMGGLLMSQILEAHVEKMDDNLFFLQANTAIDLLRACLEKHQLAIIDEAMVKDGHHIYEIIVAKKGQDVSYSEEDLMFGPVLRQKQGPLFEEKWMHALEVQRRILKSLDPQHEKYAKVLKEKEMIEKVLDHAG
jgi:tRNA (adenine22-N1)-methyltransferase